MKSYINYAFIAAVLLSLTSCEAVDTIFQAGKIWGIVVAVVVIGLALFLINMFRKK